MDLRREWGRVADGAHIEHNLDVIRNADWIVDLGPEGGTRGGELVFTGTPMQLLDAPRSLTGEFLRRDVPAAA